MDSKSARNLRTCAAMKPEEFDKIFNDGEQDMTPYLDVSTTPIPSHG